MFYTYSFSWREKSETYSFADVMAIDDDAAYN